MAEQGTLCTNADVVEEAGARANSTYTAEAYTNKYIKKAEGRVCAIGRYDFVTNYSNVTTIGKEFLRALTSKIAALSCMRQDLSPFYTIAEAQTMLNILADEIFVMEQKVEAENLKFLKVA